MNHSVWEVLGHLSHLLTSFALAPAIGGGSLVAYVVVEYLKRRDKKPNTVVRAATDTAALQALVEEVGERHQAATCYVLDLHNGTVNLNGQGINRMSMEAEWARPAPASAFGAPAVRRISDMVQDIRIVGNQATLVRDIVLAGHRGWWIPNLASLSADLYVQMTRFRPLSAVYGRALLDRAGCPVKLFMLAFDDLAGERHFTEADLAQFAGEAARAEAKIPRRP